MKTIEHGKFAAWEKLDFAQTTFQKLGMSDRRQSLPWMMKQQLYLAKTPFPQDQDADLYLVIGEQDLNYRTLGQLANAVAPFGDIGNGVIVGDFRIPVQVGEMLEDEKRGVSIPPYKKPLSDLHRDHLMDDIIGPEYRQFTVDHNKRWFEILEGDATTAALNHAISSFRFRDLQQEFTTVLPANLKMVDDLANGISFSDPLANNEVHSLAGALDYFSEGTPFRLFLDAKVAISQLRASLQIQTGQQLFFHSPLQEKASYVREFVSRFDEPEKFELYLKRVRQYDPDGIYFDWNNKHVWSEHKGINIEFVDQHTLSVKTDNPFEKRESTVKFAEVEDKSGGKKLGIDSVEGVAYPQGIHGALAWLLLLKEGTRRFATQKEVLTTFSQSTPFCESLDVYAGRLMLGFLSKDIVDAFNPEMFLIHRQSKAPQKIMGAQTAVWLSLDKSYTEGDEERYDHTQRLLSGNNSVITALEEYIDSG